MTIGKRGLTTKKPGESFQEGVILLFACSGGSKAGEVTDIIARKLQASGDVLMSCVCAVSGQITGHLEKLKKDRKVIVLDGCTNDCVSRTLENAGFRNFIHIRLNEFGVTERNAIVKEGIVNKVIDHVKETIKKTSKWEFSYLPSKDLFKRR